MPIPLGAHADRVRDVRELFTTKGRREQQRFAFEGGTLLGEAIRSGTPIESLYVTESAFAGSVAAHELESAGTSVYLVDDRIAAKISDLETPTGMVAVSPLRLSPLSVLFENPGLILVLADLNDPGNAGTLLRSAEAFGATGVVFGHLGVDPYHPKVVRGAMGAVFRLPLAVADPAAFSAAAATANVPAIGLAAGGGRIEAAEFGPSVALVVGHERRGLGHWSEACERTLAIPMQGSTESLNAAVAGSIALYEASKRRQANGG